MKFYIKLEKAVDNPASKGNKERGEVRGGKFLRRIRNGTEKDGSPQYRYIRSQEELDAYEASKKKNKPKDSDSGEKLKNKTDKEHKKSSEKVKDTVKDKKKTKKSIRFVIKKGA